MCSAGMACLSGFCIDKKDMDRTAVKGPLWAISSPVDAELSLGFRMQDELLVSRGRVVEVLLGRLGDV